MFDQFRRLVRRAPKLPPQRRPALAPQERVVAWAEVSADETVVVTNRGLWLPGEAARLGWHEIHKAVWSGRQLTVVPARVVEAREGYAVVADLPARTLLLLAPDDVPEQVRARVSGSVAYTRHHPAPGGGGVRVVARRVSGVDGVTWTVRPDPGTGIDDPAARAALDELVAQGRAQLPGVG